MKDDPSTQADLNLQRHWPLEGTYNLRDVGGYTTHDGSYTQWRTLYRSDGLHRVPKAAQRSLIDSGLRTVIDLRTKIEVVTAPNVFADSEEVAYVHLPMLAPHIVSQHRADSLEELYKLLIDGYGAQIADVITELGDRDGFPAIVHCSAGKDRTGVVIALLLELVGVTRDQIVEDYVLTKRYVTPLYEELRRAAAQIDHDLGRLERMLGCSRNAIRKALEYVDSTYGGAREYVRSMGLGEGTLERLRAALLEAPSSED